MLNYKNQPKNWLKSEKISTQKNWSFIEDEKLPFPVQTNKKVKLSYCSYNTIQLITVNNIHY